MHWTAYQNELGAENEGRDSVATRVVPTRVWQRTIRDELRRIRRPSSRRSASSRGDVWPRAQRADLVALGVGAALSLAALIGFLL